MQTHLILQKGEKRYLLIRSFDYIHLITMDSRLTEQNEDWLLAQPRTVEEMNRLQLSRSTIELKNLRGFSITGLEAGDTIQIYTKEGKRRYQFAVACTEEKLDNLFRGFTRFNPPKPIDWRAWETERDWRMPMQEPGLWKKLCLVGCALNVLALLSGLALLIMGYAWLWLNWLCLGCFLAAIAVFCLYPAYFTIFEDKRAMGKNKIIAIYLPVMLCPMALFAAEMAYCCVLAWWKAWALGTVAVMLLTVLFWKRSPEFREPARVIGFLLVGALISPGPIMAANILLDAAPVRKIHAEAVDRENSSGRGGTFYYIYVMLDGEEQKIPVYRSTYEQTQPGDRVEIVVHEGALGIPYARSE